MQIGAAHGFIDPKGKVVIPPGPKFSAFGDRFSEGLVVFGLPKKGCGYLDRDGKIVIPPRFKRAEPFSEGLAAVCVQNEDRSWTWGYVDKTGKLVIPAVYIGFAESEPRLKTAKRTRGPYRPRAAPFREGLAAVRQRGPGFGYIDKAGKLAIKMRFSYAGEFSGGLAPVRFGQDAGWKYGYIDKEGKIVVKARYDWAGSHSDGMARVQVGLQFGYVDQTGKLAIKPRYEYAGDFSDGLAAVKSDGKWGYIDKAGKEVIKPQFTNAAPFRHGLAWVWWTKDKRHCNGYVDKLGKVVWKDRPVENTSVHQPKKTPSTIPPRTEPKKQPNSTPAT